LIAGFFPQDLYSDIERLIIFLNDTNHLNPGRMRRLYLKKGKDQASNEAQKGTAGPKIVYRITGYRSSVWCIAAKHPHRFFPTIAPPRWIVPLKNTQGRDTLPENTWKAAGHPDRIHPGARRYLAELGLN
jgi:hypothetical protein